VTICHNIGIRQVKRKCFDGTRAHLGTVTDSLSPLGRGEGWGEGNLKEVASSPRPSPPLREEREKNGGSVERYTLAQLTPSDSSLSICSQCQEYVFQRASGTALTAEFIAVAHGNQSSIVNDADAVRHFLGHAQLMRGDEHGHAFD
jgi:hypothetical protein